ncbi:MULTISPECIES: antA/AntB antirepressor family protein, partial [unclassified Bartonella]
MNTLIPISEQTVGQETVQTVNARDLHAFLEVGKDFSTWIKYRINKYN